MKKLKVAVVFGGRSGEHEVSLVSATSVIKALSPEKYEVVEIGITKDGKWYRGEQCLQKFKEGNFKGLEEVLLGMDPAKHKNIDIFFPVLHGPYGEDGTIQGLFEMIQVPYVGCNVVASAGAMDKLIAKAVWEAAGIPVVPYVGFTRGRWEKEREVVLAEIENSLGLPCFVKPANMGSSVGVSKAKTPEGLVAAIELAAKYDMRILVETALNVREIECAIMGNEEVVASPVGEVIVGGEFYDFNDKYVNGVSSTEIPAKIDAATASKIQEISIKGYKSLDCCGLARVDSFIDKDTGAVFLNEINTLPGFTSISMYPKMMQAYGLSYEELVDKLIELGLERAAEKAKNQVVFESNSDWFKKS